MSHSRAESSRLLLKIKPSDITDEEAQESFALESAGHLRQLVVNATQCGAHWEKIRSDRIVRQREEERARAAGVALFWGDIINHFDRLNAASAS